MKCFKCLTIRSYCYCTFANPDIVIDCYGNTNIDFILAVSTDIMARSICVKITWKFSFMDNDNSIIIVVLWRIVGMQRKLRDLTDPRLCPRFIDLHTVLWQSDLKRVLMMCYRWNFNTGSSGFHNLIKPYSCTLKETLFVLHVHKFSRMLFIGKQHPIVS